MDLVRGVLSIGAAGLLVCAAGCRHAQSDANRGAAQAASLGAPASDPPTAALRVLDEREVTAELRAKAVEVLEEHSAEALGTEIPIESGGRRYVARLEEHWDAERGPHRGVTLYTRNTE